MLLFENWSSFLKKCSDLEKNALTVRIYRLRFSFNFSFSISRVSRSQKSKIFACVATFLSVVKQIFIKMHWFQKTSLPWTISSWPSAKFLSVSKKSTIIAFFRSQLKFLSSWSLHWAVILQKRYILKLTMSLKSSYSWRVAELSRHRTRAAIKMLLRTYSLLRNKLLHKFLSAALRHRFKNTYLPKMGLFRSFIFLLGKYEEIQTISHI